MPKASPLFFICLFFFLKLVNLAQHSDCKNALVYDSKREGNISVPKGYGQEKEIFGHDIYNDYYFTEEHNTLWVYLYFRDSTEFEFELTPKKGNDDFDFMLYKIDRPNFCDYLKAKQPIPIRSNLARKHPKTGSITGMRKEYTNSFAKAGYEPYFSSTLKVNAGQEFYLIIDSPYGSDAYFNLFSQTTFIDTNIVPKKNMEIKKESSSLNSPALKKSTKASVSFINPNLEHVAFKGLKLAGVKPNDSLIFHLQDSIEFIINRIPEKYSFNVTAAGFEPQEFNYISTQKKDTSLIFQLRALKDGAVLNFKKIQFHSNKSTILPESYSELSRLYSFLSANEKIKVEIAGHVNGLGRNKLSYKKLAKKRAKAVYKELVSLGIDSGRLTFKGYGNKKPIYKNPTSSLQSSENRRVEIIVKALN